MHANIFKYPYFPEKCVFKRIWMKAIGLDRMQPGGTPVAACTVCCKNIYIFVAIKFCIFEGKHFFYCHFIFNCEIWKIKTLQKTHKNKWLYSQDPKLCRTFSDRMTCFITDNIETLIIIWDLHLYQTIKNNGHTTFMSNSLFKISILWVHYENASPCQWFQSDG